VDPLAAFIVGVVWLVGAGPCGGDQLLLQRGPCCFFFLVFAAVAVTYAAVCRCPVLSLLV